MKTILNDLRAYLVPFVAIALVIISIPVGTYLWLDIADKITVNESCDIPDLLEPGTLVNVKTLGVGAIIGVDHIECHDVFYQVEFIKNTCAIVPRTQMEVVLTFEIQTRT